MLVTKTEVVINEGLTVHWEAIRDLKVLNDKLLITLKGGLQVALIGLSAKSVDEIFLAYYRYLNLAPA